MREPGSNPDIDGDNHNSITDYETPLYASGEDALFALDMKDVMDEGTWDAGSAFVGVPDPADAVVPAPAQAAALQELHTPPLSPDSTSAYLASYLSSKNDVHATAAPISNLPDPGATVATPAVAAPPAGVSSIGNLPDPGATVAASPFDMPTVSPAATPQPSVIDLAYSPQPQHEYDSWSGEEAPDPASDGFAYAQADAADDPYAAPVYADYESDYEDDTDERAAAYANDYAAALNEKPPRFSSFASWQKVTLIVVVAALAAIIGFEAFEIFHGTGTAQAESEVQEQENANTDYLDINTLKGDPNVDEDE